MQMHKQVLAHMYEQGLGVTQDLERAFGLYLASAQQGNTGGQYSVGLLYRRGFRHRT